MAHKKEKQLDQLLCSIANCNHAFASLLQHTAKQERPSPQTNGCRHNLQAEKDFRQMNNKMQSMTINERKFESVFDKVEENQIDETIQGKITNLKLTQFSQRRRDDLFKRYKKDQQQRFTLKKKELQKHLKQKEPLLKLSRGEFVIRNETQNRSETFPVSEEDMQKLRPETDLNDTIIGNYLKLLSFVYLPNEDKIFIFSSFFLSKLIPDHVKEEIFYENKDSATLLLQVREKVKDNYRNVQRWTRKVDIFQKETLVFPINAFHHWFCVIVNNPHQLASTGTPTNSKCELILCDSMYEKRQFIIESIRKYLQYELEDKKKIKMDLNETNLPSYQLLLPRQTNTHDCGLYMLAYIQELLLDINLLKDLSVIENRMKLNIFPRSLINKMRERLKKLFYRLANAKEDGEKNEILVQHKSQKENILKDENDSEYDEINERQFKKYEKMNIHLVAGNNLDQKSYACKIRFYLDPEINYYEKDSK